MALDLGARLGPLLLVFALGMLAVARTGADEEDRDLAHEAWPERIFPIGVFEDAHMVNGHRVAFEEMLEDLESRNLDSVFFSNNLVRRDAALLEISDRLNFNVFFAPSELLDAWWKEDVPPDRDRAIEAIRPLLDELAPHPSLKGYSTIDEPSRALKTKLTIATEVFEALDPTRPAMPTLIGLDRAAMLFGAARPHVMLIDVYPIGYRNGPGEFSMAGFGYPGVDFVQYIRAVTRDKPVETPLWVILQAHSFRQALREPSPAELRAQQWLAIGEGATGIFWFVYSSQQGWRGLRDNPALYDEVSSLSRRLQPLRERLMDARKEADRFAISGGDRPYVSTLVSRDGQR